MTPLDRQTQRRLALIFSVFGGFALVLALRLGYWQLMPHADLQAADSAAKLQPGQIKAGRGAIYDRTGLLLAGDVAEFIVAADLRAVTNAADVAAKLSPLVGRPADELRAGLEAKDGRTYTRLARNLNEATANQVRDAKLPGILVETEAKRVYPMGSTAAHVLGFVAADGKAYTGVEEYYDNALRGEDGTWGGALLVDPTRFRAPRDGFDLVLTIDANIQRMTERELSKAVEAQDAAGGSAIVMDPKTGAILAMASVPTYDPNRFATTPPDRFENPVISKLYEPGSVLKAVTLAAALEEGVASLNTSYDDVGYMRVGGVTIWDWDRVAHGRVDMRTMMRLSLNVGAVHLVQMLGPERFYKHLRDFGFGAPTGIDLTGEVGGLIRDYKSQGWGDLDLATNAFGQGMAATPIQVITAMAAIANGGRLVQPYVVQQIRQGDRVIKDTRPIAVRQVVSPQNIPAMHEALVGVVEQAVRASVPGYTIGGKTGSSQIPTDKGYDDELTIASFAGFGPVADPQVVILVKVDKPVHRQLGSEVAAPFFGVLARQVFDYPGVPPDNVRLAAENRKPKPGGDTQ